MTGQDNPAAKERITVEASGFTFHALTEGDGPLVLCLHGFPDYPGTFGAQMTALAAQGYRVVAPWQRGYHPDTLSPDNRYQTMEMSRDALNLIEALGYQQAVVFGHDWGAPIASGAAVLGPDKVRALITAAVPYGNRLGEMFLTDPDQQRRSWYMFFFQTALAEMAVSHDNLAFIRRLWQDWSPGWNYTEEQIGPVLDTLSQPGVLAAAITYYRCSLDPAYQHEDVAKNQARMGEVLATPTLHLHGGRDGCISTDSTAGMAAHFSGPFELEILPHVGHFLQQEDPDSVNARLLKFLATHAAI